MHQQLDIYLKRIQSQLKRLPAHEQEQHLEEIAQHLQALISQKRTQGLSEDAAVRATLAQFGNPDQVGRALEQASSGARTGVVQGFLVGAGVGVALLVLSGMGVALMDPTASGWRDIGGLGSVGERLAEVALGGGVASLVGRRFTRGYLTRPARPLPEFTAWSQSLTVAVRLLGVGLVRGSVGGAVFGALNTTLALHDPHSTVTLPSEMMAYLATLTLFSTGMGAMALGLVSAVVGLVLGSMPRFSGKVQRT